MSMTPGIYRGGSPGCFGLWRLTPDGRLLFSMPVDGQRWRTATTCGHELENLVLIAADSESGPATRADAAESEMRQRELHHFETEQALTTILAIATKTHSQSWLEDLERIADVARKAIA